MKIERTCRNPACGKVNVVPRFSKPDSAPMRRCSKCKTPYGPLAFGLDRDTDVPTGLTAAEKGAEWRAQLDRFRKAVSAGGTIDE